MKKYMSFLIITVIILSCCKPNNPNSTDTSVIEEIKIDAKEGIIYPLDSLFSGKVWFVKLETKNDNLIGEVSNIFFDDDLIFDTFRLPCLKKKYSVKKGFYTVVEPEAIPYFIDILSNILLNLNRLKK
jgi:hypothetical protein